MVDFKTQLDQINVERSHFEAQESLLLGLQIKQQRGETVTPESLQTAQNQLAAAKAQLQNQIAVLHQDQPADSLVDNWETGVPLLMLPVKLQTRLVTREPDPVGGGYFELLVRIYPDDIYTCSHEEMLTDSEVTAGKHYWDAIRLAEQPSVSSDQQVVKKQEAWRELSAQFGGGRSLYITRITMPSNRAVLGQLASTEAMQFSNTLLDETKANSWSKAATTSLLPDRFQVLVYKSSEPNAEPQIIQNGNLIPDTLQLGIDPLNESGKFIKQGGDINPGDEIKWMTDFAEAERVGMGVRIPIPVSFYLPPQTSVAPTQPQGQALYLAQIGIPRIVVVGVLTSSDKNRSAELLQKTFENHLYSSKGLAFLKMGTPTNNTDENNSPWSIYGDHLVDDYYEGFKTFEDNDPRCDGARMANAFGIAKAAFQAVPQAGKRDVDVTRQINKALYPATIGYYFNELMRGIALDRQELQAFFENYVIGGGSYSAFRIGNQPYGVVLAGNASSDTPFYQNLNRVLSRLATEVWLPLGNQAARVGLGNNPARTLVDILSLHAQSVELGQQWFYPTDPMMSSKIPTFNDEKLKSNILLAKFLLNLGYSHSSIVPAQTQLSAAQARLAEFQARIAGLEAAAAEAENRVAVLDQRIEILSDPEPDQEIPGRPGDRARKKLQQLAALRQQRENAQALAITARNQVDAGFAAIAQATNDVQGAERALFGLLTTALGSLLNYTNQPNFTLTTNNLVGSGKQDEAVTPPTASFNYLDWLAKLSSIRDLETLPLGTREEVASLLFLMVRQAFLLLFGKAFEQLVSLPIFKSSQTELAVEVTKKLAALDMATAFNISANSPSSTIWEIFQSIVPLDNTPGSVTAPFAGQFVDKPLSTILLSPTELDIIIDNLKNSTDPLLLANLRPIQAFVEFRQSLAFLAGLTTDELEQALNSHLDCASYRLDAWLEGSIARRLEQQREKNPDGIYLGAFGWVENLKFRSAGQQNEGGFIHAPSPAHATMAAVMKSAFLNHKQDGKSAFALNLSSQRLQRAQEVLERFRGDERIEAILGFQFERELQDASSSQNNASAAYILEFRKQYPIKVTQIAASPGATPEDANSTQNVVNGLQLAEEYFANPAAWKSRVVVPTGSSDESSIQKAVGNLADTLDALKDLLSAETAYRMAQGNFDALGATLDALNKGKLPPDLGFTESARQPLFQFSNRFAVHFDVEGVAASFPDSPRAAAEPGLNSWCGRLLGPLQLIGFTVNTEIPSNTVSTPTTLTLENLNIQPLDLVCLASNPSELEARAAYAYRSKSSLGDDVPVRINFSETGASDLRPLNEVLPIALALHRVISSARPLTAQDYIPSGVTEHPALIEIDEYSQRIAFIINSLDAIVGKIKATQLSQNLILADDTQTLATLEDVFNALKKVKHETTSSDWLLNVLIDSTTLQNQLIQLSAYGIAEAFPRQAEAGNPSSIIELLRQAAVVVDTTYQLLTEIRKDFANLPAFNDSPLNHVETLMQLGKKVLSGTMPLLPRFRYVNGPEIAESDKRRAELLQGTATDPTPADMKVEEWLQGVARVRPKLAQWENLRFMTAASQAASEDLIPLQIPTDALEQRQADGARTPIYTWVATEFPNGISLRREVVSIVVTGATATATMQLQTGLLLDEWSETIPTDEELSALTFHYNQPNAEAPQSLLLSVCPTEKWTWQAVVTNVTDTLAKAKMRTVDLMQIKTAAANGSSPTLQALAQMLPMLIAPVNAQQHTYSLDYALIGNKERETLTQLTDESIGHYQIWKE